MIPWILNWIIFWIESPDFILNWIKPSRVMYMVKFGPRVQCSILQQFYNFTVLNFGYDFFSIGTFFGQPVDDLWSKKIQRPNLEWLFGGRCYIHYSAQMILYFCKKGNAKEGEIISPWLYPLVSVQVKRSRRKRKNLQNLKNA